MDIKLYAVFYKTNKSGNWLYYGAFTTLEMANDLVKHIKKRMSVRAVETTISVFVCQKEQEEE